MNQDMGIAQPPGGLTIGDLAEQAGEAAIADLRADVADMPPLLYRSTVLDLIDQVTR